YQQGLHDHGCSSDRAAIPGYVQGVPAATEGRDVYDRPGAAEDVRIIQQRAMRRHQPEAPSAFLVLVPGSEPRTRTKNQEPRTRLKTRLLADWHADENQSAQETMTSGPSASL